MHYFFNTSRVRVLAAGALLVVAAAVAACGGNPVQPPPPPVSAGSTPGSGQVGDRHLSLTVMDQDGYQLGGAEVRIRASAGSSFRANARANGIGQVNFNRVPAQVQAQVIYQARIVRFGKTYDARGNGDQQLEIPDNGTNSLQMSIPVVYTEVPTLPGR